MKAGARAGRRGLRHRTRTRNETVAARAGNEPERPPGVISSRGTARFGAGGGWKADRHGSGLGLPNPHQRSARGTPQSLNAVEGGRFRRPAAAAASGAIGPGSRRKSPRRRDSRRPPGRCPEPEPVRTNGGRERGAVPRSTVVPNTSGRSGTWGARASPGDRDRTPAGSLRHDPSCAGGSRNGPTRNSTAKHRSRGR